MKRSNVPMDESTLNMRCDRSIVDDEAKRAEIEDASIPFVNARVIQFFSPHFGWFIRDDREKWKPPCKFAFSGASLRRAPPPGKDDALAMLIVKEAFPKITAVRSATLSRTNYIPDPLCTYTNVD